MFVSLVQRSKLTFGEKILFLANFLLDVKPNKYYNVPKDIIFCEKCRWILLFLKMYFNV